MATGNTISDRGVKRLHEIDRRVGGGKTSRRPVPTRRRDRNSKKEGGKEGLHVLRGTVMGAVYENTSRIMLTGLQVVRGRMPTDEDGDLGVISVTNSPPCVFDSGDVCYAAFNELAGEDERDRWDTGDAHNFLAIYKGLGSYSESSAQTVWHQENSSIRWHTLDHEKVVEDYDHDDTEFDTKYITVFYADTTGVTDLPTEPCPT